MKNYQPLEILIKLNLQNINDNMKDVSYDKKDNSFRYVRFKSFKELEKDEFKDIKLDDFKKSRLNEFKNKEKIDFKRFLEHSKLTRSIENLRTQLNSDNAIKNVLKELEDIGLDGRPSLKLLKIIKKLN